jgi:DNA-directed RNA polymerase sigma subunit (sigma70/sigma32)
VTVIRAFKYVALPAPKCQLHTSDDWLEALIETIEEEFDESELRAFAKLPASQDPVYRLIVRRYRGEIDLVDIARMYGLTRERVRQIEGEAIAKVRSGLMEWRPG